MAKYCAKLNKQHWEAVKRVMRYLKGTLNFGLLYTSDGSGECIGYSDANWVGKSSSGYVFQIGG